MAEGRRKKRFGDFDAAIEMREVVAELVKTELQKQRPRYRYATVDSITPAAFKAYVTFNGEDVSVLVNTGAFNFVLPGDTVRIEGIGVDKYIAGVVDRGISATGEGVIELGITGGQAVGDIIYSAASSKGNALRANGSAVSRTTYAALFAVIGTTFGSGDGSTTFNLPDLEARVVIGQDSSDSSFNSLGETGGAKTHVHSLSDAWAEFRMASGQTKIAVIAKTISSRALNRSAQLVNSAFDESSTSNQAIALGGDTDSGSSLPPYITMYPYIIHTLAAVTVGNPQVPEPSLPNEIANKAYVDGIVRVETHTESDPPSAYSQGVTISDGGGTSLYFPTLQYSTVETVKVNDSRTVQRMTEKVGSSTGVPRIYTRTSVNSSTWGAWTLVSSSGGDWLTTGISYESGYTGTGVSTALVGYMREGHWVNLKGLVSKTGGWPTTTSELAMTLPSGIRPSGRTFLQAAHNEAGGAGSNGMWVIETDGRVYIRPHANALSNGYYSFDGLRYWSPA